jgi:hypothetical protein
MIFETHFVVSMHSAPIQWFSHPPQFFKLLASTAKAALIVTGYKNKGNLRKMLLKFYKHICATRASSTLDHCYCAFRDGYKDLPCPPFSKSDHASIVHLPSYRQKLIQEVPVVRIVQHWSDQSESILQACFDHADWELFWVASENSIEIYTDSVTVFIRKCIEDVVPTVMIRTYPNQKTVDR